MKKELYIKGTNIEVCLTRNLVEGVSSAFGTSDFVSNVVDNLACVADQLEDLKPTTSFTVIYANYALYGKLTHEYEFILTGLYAGRTPSKRGIIINANA